VADRGAVALEPMLAELRAELELPATPTIVPGVLAQLRADRLQRTRPPFPGIAAWSRPRRLAVALATLIALLAVAAAGRVVIGSIEIRHPVTRPSTSPPPEVDLGRPLTPAEASDRVGFTLPLPASFGPPEAAYVLANEYDARSSIVALVWRPTATLPRIGGTPWGAILMEFGGNDVGAVKDLYANPGYRRVEVNGLPGVWIDTPHVLTLFTPGGREAQFEVRGNVLAWVAADGATYRLETALDAAGALRLAADLP
jgi:hypothetical protein